MTAHAELRQAARGALAGPPITSRSGDGSAGPSDVVHTGVRLCRPDRTAQRLSGMTNSRPPSNSPRSVLAALAVVLAAVATLPCAGALSAYGAGAKPSVIHVDDNSAPGGDGSARKPFASLPDAVAEAAARALSTRIVIKVGPGDYPLTEPLQIDFPLDLRGSTEQVVNGDDPLPTGLVVPGTETRIYAAAPIGAQALVSVGRLDGAVMNDVSIRGFALESTAASNGILMTRVQGFRVADNVFRAPTMWGFVSVASSGELTANHFSGIGTGAILNGGYPASPANVVATGNRAVNNNLGGILLNGASINIPELGDQLHAIVRGNDLSGNTGSQGFGLRVFVLRRDIGAPGDSQSSAHVDARVQDNRLVGNRIGLTVDAGFPYRSVAGVCDPRVFSGTVDLDLSGNTVTGSLVTNSLITFTRSTTALNPAQLPQWQYLHGATFDLSDPDGTLKDARIDNPATDPHIGSCPGDAVHEPLENILIYNGAELTSTN